MNITRAALLSSLLTLFFAASAQASTEFTFGMGTIPDVAVDAAGTAHMAWHDSSRPLDQDVVLYCQIPRGQRACINQQTLHTGSAGALPHVLLPGPNHVVVVLGDESNNDPAVCGVANFCTYARESNNGGVSFGPLEQLADPSPSELYAVPSGQAIVGPDPGTISWVNDGNPDLLFTNASLSNSEPAEADSVELDTFASGADAEVGLHGNIPVVAWVRSEDGVIRWRAYDGSGDLNLESNWPGPTQTIEAESELDIVLAGGPNGLFLLYERGTPGNTQLVVRKFTGSGWTDPVGVSEVSSLRLFDLTQDANGKLHLVYVNNNTSPVPFLQYRTSTDGVNWSPALTINGSDDLHQRLTVGAAPDGLGFATWDSGQGPSGALHELRAVPLEPWDLLPSGDLPGPPVITNPGISDPTLLPGQGASFTFNVNEPGLAVLTFQRRYNGKKAKRRGKRICKKVSAKKFKKLKRKKRCKGWKKIGEIRQNVQPGQNTIVFNGRIAGRKLKKGIYRARLVITDLAGNVSRTETIKFKVIGKKKKRPRRRR